MEQAKFHPRNQECTEALASRSCEVAGHHARDFGAVAAAQNFSAEMGSDGAVGIGDVKVMTTGAQGVEFVDHRGHCEVQAGVGFAGTRWLCGTDGGGEQTAQHVGRFGGARLKAAGSAHDFVD